MKKLLSVFLLGCIPNVDVFPRVADGGTCEVTVVQADCATAEELEHQLQGQLPCDVCVTYYCECTAHAFCKVCNPEAIGRPCGAFSAMCFDLDLHKDTNGLR